nr:hypothetical protein [Cupriavidus sp. IDO]
MGTTAISSTWGKALRESAKWGHRMEGLYPTVGGHRNAKGLTWNGQGEMSSWLKRAVNAGQSVEFFRIG